MDKEVKGIRGYKVFNPDWTCRRFQYKVGETFEEDVVPICCKKGFHFCKKASDCFNYYSFDPNNKVAEIIALGDIDTNGIKSCTNKIQIVREIPWQELLTIINTGKDCTGLRNTGNSNTGNCNTGSWNAGDYNTGDCNTGSWNAGDCNTGSWNIGTRNTGNFNTGHSNIGYYNTGNCNTGNYNTGNYNTGDWNESSFNIGCFNTEEQKIMLFNKMSNMTYREWLNSDAKYLMNRISKNVVRWVCEDNMSDEEKMDNPTYKTTGGYLKVLDESECAQLWWDELSDYNKNIITNLPNFDAEIFRKCTGIKVK